MITLDDDAQFLPGMAFGIPQPTVIVRASIADVPEGTLERVLARLPDVIAEPFGGFDPAAAQAERVATLFAFCNGALQRQSRIGIGERFRVHPLGMTQSGASRFEFALPSAGNGKLSALAAQGAVQLIHRLAQAAWGAEVGQGLRQRADAMLRTFAEPGMNRYLMMQAALAQGIPVRSWIERFLLFGTGRHARWTESSVTDRTPSLGTLAAKNKHRTARMLREAGLPGGENLLVASREQAIDAAIRLGFPVVVKPNDRDRGEGVTADLRTAGEVATAFDEAARLSKSVLVEKYVAGYTHRLNVSFGRVDRCARKIAGVVGDGVSNLRELVDRQLQTPAHRALTQMHGRPMLQLDDEALGLLRQERRTVDDVPAAGEYVRLRRRDNAATGGTNEELDVRDPCLVHPDNIRLAEEAANLLQLDIAGVDVIMQDISKSWLEVGALICEINAQPQIPRKDLIEDIVRELVGGGTGRIPAELFVAPSHPSFARQMAERLVNSGHFDAVGSAQGITVKGVRVSQPFANGLAAGRALLMRRDIASAACIISASDIATLGLPLDRWDAVDFAPDELFPEGEQAALRTARRFLGT